ncbi:uncharacterized protein FA14DRAFT_173412 [Meira miltonrushii]|uniref:Uncharacterized protein n=1 Tax=Meira miltonrushii TaxID=1280837 RepID=A0A316V7P0_9BASI|nr:uncharacterized protein FA14DRAFT_173412 [Meira miltonrushii]PWN33639.1 hypothetical protein FA14DRAFT_173412 [Meira miltonrushii]
MRKCLTLLYFSSLLLSGLYPLCFAVSTSKGRKNVNADLNSIPTELDQGSADPNIQSSAQTLHDGAILPQTKGKKVNVPDLNFPACDIHRPDCPHWSHLNKTERKRNNQRYNRSLKTDAEKEEIRKREREYYRKLPQEKKKLISKRKYHDEQKRFSKMTTEQQQKHLKHRSKIAIKSYRKKKANDQADQE